MKHFCSSCFSLAELAAIRSHQAAKAAKSASGIFRPSCNVLKPTAHSHVKNSSSSTTAPPPPPFQWGYTDKNGPLVWPKHFPAGNGKQQSPIDIDTKAVKYDPALKVSPLKYHYDYSSARQLLNNQYTWQVNFDDSINDNTLVGGPLKTPYNLFQMHVHWHSSDEIGSEHSVDKKKYCAELHMVHYNKAKYGTLFEAVSYPDGLAVLGVFLKIGERNNEFQKLVDLFPQILLPSATISLSTRINLCDMMPENTSKYYTYQGSLTAPPLAESVTWILFPDPVEISYWQLRAFRRLHQHNWRPVQPIHDRTVRTTFGN